MATRRPEDRDIVRGTRRGSSLASVARWGTSWKACAKLQTGGILEKVGNRCAMTRTARDFARRGYLVVPVARAGMKMRALRIGGRRMRPVAISVTSPAIFDRSTSHVR
jgi:hypothetical protein